MQSWIDTELQAVHAGNCATFTRDILDRHYGKHLKLAQFSLFLDDLEAAQVEELQKAITNDAATRVSEPIAGDIVLMHRTDGQPHIGVYCNAVAPAVLHLPNRDGRAHCTKLHTLSRFGYSLDGFYRVDA